MERLCIKISLNLPPQIFVFKIIIVISIQMTEVFPIANVYSEDHFKTKQQKVQNCAQKIDEILHYICSSGYLPLAFNTPLGAENFKRLGNFFEAFSRKLSVIVVENYLHEVVTPGVPDFSSEMSKAKFWCEVCERKLDKMRGYLWLSELESNIPVLDQLWRLLAKITHGLKKVLKLVDSYYKQGV